MSSADVCVELTVVIPAYRSEKLVGRAIQSVLAEGVPPGNVVVVEDGVFDDTAAVVERFEGVRLVTLPRNGGAPRARNVGLENVMTRYVMFLDSDDYVENGLLRGLVSILDESGTDLAIGPWVYAGESRGRGMLRRPPEVSNAERIFRWLLRAFFPPCCIAWRASSVRSIGAWDERLRKDQDGELTIRALTRGLTVSVSATGNGVYWQHESPHRVTRARIADVLYAADVVFEQIESWMASGAGGEFFHRYRTALGRYCCKTAWVAFSYGEDEAGRRWAARARELGFDKKGYNQKSSLMAIFFGMRLSSRIKARGGSVYRRIAQR